MSVGRLIVIEGIDGTGKSTLCEKIEKAGYFVGRQPQRRSIGQYARDLQHSGELETPPDVTDEIINILIIADRMEQFYRPGGIVERINNGETVVMDRYFYSSIVYSSETLLTRDTMENIHQKFPQPDLILHLTIDPEEAMARMSNERDKLDIYETLDYLVPRAQKYAELFSSDKLNVVEVDASQTQEKVYECVMNEIVNL